MLLRNGAVFAIPSPTYFSLLPQEVRPTPLSYIYPLGKYTRDVLPNSRDILLSNKVLISNVTEIICLLKKKFRGKKNIFREVLLDPGSPFSPSPVELATSLWFFHVSQPSSVTEHQSVIRFIYLSPLEIDNL